MILLWASLTVVGLVALSPIALVVFNYLVDPLAVFVRDNEDNAHAVDKDIQYLSVALRIARRRPNTVLLGNSRVRNGFHGLEDEFQAWLGKWLNGGFRGARLPDQLLYGEFAIACGASRIIMFVDLPMFYLPQTQTPVGALGWRANNAQRMRVAATKRNLYGRSLWSREAITLSVNELRRRCRLPQKDKDAASAKLGYQESNEIVEEQRHRLWGHIAKSMSRSQVVSGQALESMAAFLRLSHEQGVSVDLCIEPVHARSLAIIHAHGLWPCYEQWKRDLTALTEKPELAGAMTVWDFSGYNAISTEAFPPAGDTRKMLYYFDSSHFTPLTGRMILARLSADAQMDEEWGVRLSSEMLEEHARKQCRGRGIYTSSISRRDRS